MTDQELLQAMNQMIQDSENRTKSMIKEELTAQRKEIMQDVSVLIDAEFTPKFNLLAEGQQQILGKLDRLEARVDTIEEKLYDHDEMLREHEEKLKAIC